MQSSDWPPRHSEALRDLHAKGMSYGEITKEINARFGTTYTRSAILGRAKRMALARPEIGKERGPQLKPRCARPRPECRPTASVRPRPAGEGRKPAQLRCVGISPRLISFDDLQPGDCRYPYGGDRDGEPISFCGHPRQPGSCYCTPHFHLTRNPEGQVERPPTPVVLRLVAAA